MIGTELDMGTYTEIMVLGRIVFLKKEVSAIRKIIEFDHYKRVWIASAEAYGTNPKVASSCLNNLHVEFFPKLNLGLI